MRSPACALFVSCLTACLASLAAVAAPRYDAAFALVHDDNLPRAERSRDRLSDTALELAGRLSGDLRESARSSLWWEAGVGARWWTAHPKLSEFSPELGLRYRHRLGADFKAPWVEVALSGRGIKLADSPIRDGAAARVGVSFGRSLTDALEARAGYAWHLRRAVREAVFDTENHEAFAHLDWTVGPRWVIYVGLTARVGDLVTVSSVPNPKALRNASALSKDFDFAFDETRRRAYQVEGHALMPELGVNYLLRDGLSVDLAGNGLAAAARGDNRYHQLGVTLSVLWQF